MTGPALQPSDYGHRVSSEIEAYAARIQADIEGRLRLPPIDRYAYLAGVYQGTVQHVVDTLAIRLVAIRAQHSRYIAAGDTVSLAAAAGIHFAARGLIEGLRALQAPPAPRTTEGEPHR